MAWTIKGEAGKNLDETVRSIESLGITAASLKFQSLAEDTFTWAARTNSAAGGGTIVPTLGQSVSLFLDGNRKFKGHAMRPKRGAKSVTITVQGPWWWMQKIPLTANQTDLNGGTDERVVIVFATGDLRGNIISLLDRAIALGVPMLRGTGTQIAAMYDFTKVTVANKTVAAALTQMLGKVPDAVAWFDYAVEGEHPKLKIARRNGADAAAADTFTIGADIFDGELAIYPREDLEVTRVELPYMDRNPVTGKPRFQRKGNGTAETGKLQIITVSGPEVVDRLPFEDFETASVKTVAANAIANDYISSNDSALAGIKKEFGMTGGRDSSFKTYSGTTGPGGGVTNLVTTTHTFPGLLYTRDNGATIGNLAGRYLVVSQDLPQWAKEQYGGIDVTVTGTWVAYWDAAANGGAGWDDRFEALRGGAVVGSGKFNADLTGNKSWLARSFSVRGVLIDTAFAASTVVYKAWDFDFASPPDGMAPGLRIAQNWTPWEGSFTLAYQDVSGTNHLGKMVNIIGSANACETMRAMVKSLTYDIKRGRASYALGSPARLDLGTAMGRVSLNPQDVVVEI